MPIYSKACLEKLRNRVDLVEVLSPHVEFTRSGAAYKGLCPFHDEKTPSFIIQKGDSHYHCFGCGAHGDAIRFLMEHLRLNFTDAVENLAQQFHIPLEFVEGGKEIQGPNKKDLKEALELATQLYHFCLLHTEEGHQALKYLYHRGIDLEFIQRFQIGLAPNQPELLRKTLHEKKVKDQIMEEAGLIKNRSGRWRDFFSDRITFPIKNASGATIGFSARKYKEDTFGGKYINTQETPLFKKSSVLFGLNFSRRRIAKERKVIIVEGQIDALRLIHMGFDLTVAGQGTAFGQGHVKELLNLGVHQVYLAFDPDEAGQEATFKVGNLFQKEGVEVNIIEIPVGSDPDTLLLTEGAEAFTTCLDNNTTYLKFLVQYYGRRFDMNSPAGKNELVKTIAALVRSWDQEVMVAESLRQLAQLTNISENMVGADQMRSPNLFIKQSGTIDHQEINPDRILEMDLLRWLVLLSKTHAHFFQWAADNIQTGNLQDPTCRSLYGKILSQEGAFDFISLGMVLETEQEQELLNYLMEKKINPERAEQQFKETLLRIKQRNWMLEREAINAKIQKGMHSEDEVLELLKEFNGMKEKVPELVLCEST